MKRYVQISPFYNGNGWYDQVSGILFNDKNKEYEINSNVNSSRIDVFIRRNLLVDVTYRHNNISEIAVENKKVLDQTKNHPAASNHILKEENYTIPKTIEKEETIDVIVEDTVKENKTEIIKNEDVVEAEVEEIKEDKALEAVVAKVEEKTNVSQKTTNKNSSKKKKSSKK